MFFITQSMEVKMSFYVSLNDAKNTLGSRQELRDEVEDWWKSVGAEFPVQFSDCGILGREPAMRLEFFKFYQMCSSAQIHPACIAAKDELFVTSKPKMSLVYPMMLKGISKKGSPIMQKERLVEVNTHSGRSTLGETGALNFHYSRMNKICPELSLWDMSESMKKWKEQGLYYEGYLSLCVAHGVLFEDYHGPGESGKALSDFTERVFEPAFQWLERKFGVGPIIVALPWKNSYHLHPDESILEQMTGNKGTINLAPIESLL